LPKFKPQSSQEKFSAHVNARPYCASGVSFTPVTRPLACQTNLLFSAISGLSTLAY
jgi:hypothetical protein